jgi:hypothetical protein
MSEWTWCTHVQRDFTKYREGQFRRQCPEVQHLVLRSRLVKRDEHPLEVLREQDIGDVLDGGLAREDLARMALSSPAVAYGE